MKYSLTIGIPAYNEGKNIKTLLSNLMKQRMSLYTLDQIIVSSDGSNDNTVQVVKSINNPLIKIVDNKNREGIARGLNQIIGLCRSDILVTIDADITIKDADFIDELIKPIVEQKADHTASAIQYLSGHSLVNRALQAGADLKQVLFDSLEDTNNIYHCFGLARAYTRLLYQDMSIPTSIGNDMYTYLYCIARGLKFIYSAKSIARYKLPSTLNDHLNQSKRFLVSGKGMSIIFGAELVNRQLRIAPKYILVATTRSIPYILREPFSIFVYLILQIYTRVIKHDEVKQAWVIAESSK